MGSVVDQLAIHPFISSLIRRMDGIHEYLNRGLYEPALSSMTLVSHSLKPITKSSENEEKLIENMRKTIRARDKLRSGNPVVIQGKLDQFDWRLRGNYKIYFDELSELLWNGGYYSFLKDAGFYNPSQGRKSGR